MRQDPFPDPGPDGEKPDCSPLPPAAEGDGPADGGSGMDQGPYVCLPAIAGCALSASMSTASLAVLPPSSLAMSCLPAGMLPRPRAYSES
jgi:hypothetical protein